MCTSDVILVCISDVPAFKLPLLRRKHKKPKLHDGPEPWHVVAPLRAREEPNLHSQGGGNTQHGTGIHGNKISAYPQTQSNVIKHAFCLFAVLLHDDPFVDVHGTVITVVTATTALICILLLCGHEDGWSQAGSKGKCEALVIVCHHQ